MKKLVSILVPCYNEANSLPFLFNELEMVVTANPQYDWEYLFVNDGSKDNTLETLRNLRQNCSRVNYLDLSRNYGKEVAMLAGFDYVKGDCMIIMDADLQHPPAAIPSMLEKWEDGYDDIYAKRLSRGKESWLRKKLTMAYYRLLSKSSRMDVLPNVGDFRLLDKKCIYALRSMRENNRYTKGMYCYIGFNKTSIEFETQERIAGTSSMSFKTLINLAVEGILSYTTAPLRIATLIGGATSFLAFVYMIFVLFKAIIAGDPVRGFPTLLIVILLLGGIQLMSLGIIGEYLGRVFSETKDRPAYFARTYNDEII